ncbi:MAG: M23 family metallopeptidase [Betaproteobacteria bacterium]|nr:M23 family metallopeptidase [Betaproteobacteria bacterium]
MSHHAPLLRAAALAAFAVSGAVAAFTAIVPATDAELLVAKTALREPLEIRAQAALLPAPATYIRAERFERGDTLAGLLARLSIGAGDAQMLVRRREAKLLRPGAIVTAEVRAGKESEGELVWLEFLAARDALVRIERIGEGLAARVERPAIATHRELKSAVVRSSLFAAADAAGIPDSVSIQLADVFGGDIDFHRELRVGDRFSVLYEMHSLDGRPLRAGRVIATEFVNQGKTYRAVRFGEGHFAPDGKNLRKAFLRSPLEFSRVSSGFGMRRHPFLRSWRAHQGVDYAARAGTRVRAVSDGIVEFAGRNGGYGNVVVLRHQGRYSTLYAHLSGFARGIRAGARVVQGETIGAVGQTGWATGPHLHYEFRIAGTARNPLSVALPAAAPLATHELEAFRAHAQPLFAQLDLLAQIRVASADAAFE